jgi:WD40 repeat protein
VRQIGQHDRGVSAVAALPDDKVVSGGNDGKLLLWASTHASGQPVELGRHDGPVRELAVLPDGRLVSVSSDGRVLLWDLAALVAKRPNSAATKTTR